VSKQASKQYLNVTDTFCQFCGIYGISDLEAHLKVIQGC